MKIRQAASALDFSNLHRVVEGDTSTVVPALDLTWSDLDRLRWHAAVISLDCGTEVEVSRASMTFNGKPMTGQYQVSTLGLSSTTGAFAYTWSFLSGIGFGVRSSASQRDAKAQL